MFRRKSLLMLPILLIGSVLTGCNDPTNSVSSSVPSSNVEPEYEIVDVLTPRTNEYSKEYDIEAKLTAAEFGKSPDLCENLIQAVQIEKLVDGDTINVKATCKGQPETIKIRFYNVDTPETHHPEKGTEPWGMAAAQYTKKRIEEAVSAGKKIIIEGGKTGFEVTYERKVGYVWVDGILLNAQLVEIGLGNSMIGNQRQERHYNLFKATSDNAVGWYRVPENGYRENMMDLAISNTDPNWDYSRALECNGQPIESSVCIKDQQYQYRFEEIGPTQK